MGGLELILGAGGDCRSREDRGIRMFKLWVNKNQRQILRLY